MVAPSNLIKCGRFPQMPAVRLLWELLPDVAKKELLIYVRNNYPRSESAGLKFSEIAAIHKHFTSIPSISQSKGAAS